MPAKLRKGDKVVVLTGKDKGRQGEITKMMPKEGRAVVGGINMAVRHEKQTPQSQGGRRPLERSIDLSNIALVDPKDGGPTRVGFQKNEDGKLVRVARKSGEVIDG